MRSVYKLHIHRWATSVKLNMAGAMLAQNIAVNAERCFVLVDKLRKGTIDLRLPPRPPPEVWFPLYEDHRRMTGALADLFPDLLGDGESVQALLDESRAFSVFAKNDPAGLRDWLDRAGPVVLRKWLYFGYRTAHRVYKRGLKTRRRELSDDLSDHGMDFGQQLRNSPELYFYVRVVLPCLAVYKTLPSSLFRRARPNGPGQADAVEKLVRVDDMAQHHKLIERWCNGVDGAIRADRKSLLRLWEERGLKDGQFSCCQMKQSLGGLIWAMSE
jgi:hypothetical protein